MGTCRNAVRVMGLALGYLVLTPTESWAYIDPGTGSYLFQLAAAGTLSGLYLLRRYWGQLKAFIARPRAESSKTESHEPTSRDGDLR